MATAALAKLYIYVSSSAVKDFIDKLYEIIENQKGDYTLSNAFIGRIKFTREICSDYKTSSLKCSKNVKTA